MVTWFPWAMMLSQVFIAAMAKRWPGPRASFRTRSSVVQPGAVHLGGVGLSVSAGRVDGLPVASGWETEVNRAERNGFQG